MKALFRFAVAALVAAGAAPAASADAAAQFPERPVRIVIGFTPGGGPDITARFLAQKLAERWRQQVVDVASLRLTGRLLGSESNQAALEFLAAAEGNTWERVDQTVALVAGLPESQLR